MYNGERPICAAKGKQSNTMASCPPPPPRPPKTCHFLGGRGAKFGWPVAATVCVDLDPGPRGGGGRLRGSWDANYPPPPPRGLRPTVSCQRCRPQASMGA